MGEFEVAIVSEADYKRLSESRLMPDALAEDSLYRLYARSYRLAGTAMLGACINGPIKRGFDDGHILALIDLLDVNFEFVGQVDSVVDNQGIWMPRSASAKEINLGMLRVPAKLNKGFLLPL